MGLLTDAPQERFDHLRYVELKHGRVCMLAVVGNLITAAGVRLPGYCSFSADLKFDDIPSGLAAFPALPGAGTIQIIGFILLLEMSMRDATGNSEFIGDYRNDFIDFGWDKFDEATKLKKRAIELNNGRAAMMVRSTLLRYFSSVFSPRPFTHEHNSQGITGLVVHESMGNLGEIIPL